MEAFNALIAYVTFHRRQTPKCRLREKATLFWANVQGVKSAVGLWTEISIVGVHSSLLHWVILGGIGTSLHAYRLSNSQSRHKTTVYSCIKQLWSKFASKNWRFLSLKFDVSLFCNKLPSYPTTHLRAMSLTRGRTAEWSWFPCWSVYSNPGWPGPCRLGNVSLPRSAEEICNRKRQLCLATYSDFFFFFDAVHAAWVTCFCFTQRTNMQARNALLWVRNYWFTSLISLMWQSLQNQIVLNLNQCCA